MDFTLEHFVMLLQLPLQRLRRPQVPPVLLGPPLPQVLLPKKEAHLSMSRPMNIYSGPNKGDSKSSHDRYLKPEEGTANQNRPRARSIIGAGILKVPEKPLTTHEKFQRALAQEELKKFAANEPTNTTVAVEEPQQKPKPQQSQPTESSKPMTTHEKFEQALRKEQMTKYATENHIDAHESSETSRTVVDDSQLEVKPKPKYHIPSGSSVDVKTPESSAWKKSYAQKKTQQQAQPESERMTSYQRFEKNLRQQQMEKYEHEGDQTVLSNNQ